MENVTAILERARQRAAERGLPYRGALTPAETFTVWQSMPGAQVVDVRTRAELDWVGRVPGAVHIEWNSYPGSVRNARFAEDHAAALAAQLGYGEAYNILEGFEGDKDPQGHRNTLNGWRVAGLPWTQG